MAGPQILLVDDDSEICEFLAILLDLEGFTPLYTTRAEEALVYAEREQPAAVLLDVAMPDVDGFEVCRRLRASGVRSAILLVSARPGDELARRAVAAGADEFIRKPFDNAELVSRLRHWTREERRAERPAP
jgi:two-component system OmpR family response regulator